MRGVVALLAGALLVQGQSPEALFHEAVAAQKAGDDATAIQKYQQLEKLRPDVMEVHANLGAVFAHSGQYPEAIREYEDALKLAPANEAVQGNLALAYYKQGNWQAAADRFASLNRSHPDDARLATLLADSYVHLNRNDDAIALMRSIEAAHPESMDATRVLGTALLHAGKLQEASKLLHRYAEASNDAQAYLLAGQTALQLNEFERVKMDAEAAERLNPNLPGVKTLKGQALSYLLDEKGAIEALQLAVKAKPDDFQAQVTLGSLLNGQRDPAAREHLERALKLNPSSALARYELGRAQQTAGDLQAAQKSLEQVTAAEPDWLPPHVALAAVYARLKKLTEAQRERQIVDRLTAEQQKKENPGSSAAPSQ